MLKLQNNQPGLQLKKKKMPMFIKKHCLEEHKRIMNGEDLNKPEKI